MEAKKKYLVENVNMTVAGAIHSIYRARTSNEQQTAHDRRKQVRDIEWLIQPMRRNIIFFLFA